MTGELQYDGQDHRSWIPLSEIFRLPQWMRIESAPQDGRYILACNMDTKPDAVFWDRVDLKWSSTWTPTHWIPLPQGSIDCGNDEGEPLPPWPPGSAPAATATPAATPPPTCQSLELQLGELKLQINELKLQIEKNTQR